MNGVYIITTKIGKYKDAAQNIKIDDRMLSLNISRLSMNRKEPPLHNIAEALSGCLCDPVFIRPEDKYETIVFAPPGYETFLATQKSKDFYSKSYLKTKNLLMVSEWNYRCNNPSIYNPPEYTKRLSIMIRKRIMDWMWNMNYICFSGLWRKKIACH